MEKERIFQLFICLQTSRSAHDDDFLSPDQRKNSND